MLCIGTLPALAAQDLAVQFNPSIRQGLRYTYVEIYRIDVLQYTAELSAGVNFLIGPVIISPQISFLLAPPPAVDPTIFFSFRGDWGAGVNLRAAYVFSPGFTLGLEAGADFRFFWNTTVFFAHPRAGLFLLFPFRYYDNAPGLALETFVLANFRTDSELSLMGGLGLVVYL